MRHFPNSSLFATEPVLKYYQHEERCLAELDNFFWKTFDYLRFNEVEGDYLEFGSGYTVRSFRLAAKYRASWYHKPKLFAFDSFSGLPEMKMDEANPNWKPGDMAVTLQEFHGLLELAGVKSSEYNVVPGFYSETLSGHKPIEYGITSASFIFVDCDLYSSTVPVLNFAEELFNDGSVIAFDDWNCYKSRPQKGEQQAFSEFRRAHPRLAFTEFLTFGWHGKSFIVHHAD